MKRRGLGLVVAAVALVGWHEYVNVYDAAPPSCASLGCDTALCTRAGMCRCNGEVCSAPRPDGGLFSVTDDDAPANAP